jgi:hypothetical protein
MFSLPKANGLVGRVWASPPRLSTAEMRGICLYLGANGALGCMAFTQANRILSMP